MFSSCEKENEVNLDSLSTTIYNNDISNYLNLLKTQSSKENTPKIDELINAVNLNNVKIYSLKTTEKLLVVDLNLLKGFESSDKTKVIFFVNENKISHSNIVTFNNKVPFDNLDKVILSVLNLDKSIPSYSGKVSFYNMHQRIRYADEFDNGKRTKHGTARLNLNKKITSKTGSLCSTWYWVLTYPDGMQEWTFLYTDCSPCDQLDSRTASPCGGGVDGSGGGGGAGGDGGTDVLMAEAIEDNIDDTKLDPCSKGILDKLKYLTTNDIASIFKKLGGNSQIYTLTFEIANNNGNPASTNSTSYNCYKTVIDNDFLYGIDGTGINKPPTDLAIAAVMMHEVVHSYFFSLYDDKINSGVTNAFDNFDLLYQNYVTKTYVGADDAQHAQIWKSFIGSMASALQEYHTGISTATPSQFYKDIILGTLISTQTFKNKYPDGSIEYKRILNNWTTEKNNGSIDPNYTPKGKPCN